MLARPEVRRVILDLRNNSGGSTQILNPWIEQIKASRFNRPGHLFVIVGKATYSAAMEAANRLHDESAAIFVGEPTGAKPRFLLRKGDFGLPYFGIRVSYSSGVETASDRGPTMIPDIRVPVTWQDYINGVDPALDVILSRSGRQPAGH
jgi:Peptidase family S41